MTLVRPAEPADRESILAVVRTAFGSEEEVGLSEGSGPRRATCPTWSWWPSPTERSWVMFYTASGWSDPIVSPPWPRWRSPRLTSDKEWARPWSARPSAGRTGPGGP